MKPTWKPHEKHGQLTERGDLPSSVFAYPKERKEPMTDASHVRNAIARFDQVRGVSDDERDLGFMNIKKAAKHYGVAMAEGDWHELGRRPRAGRPESARKHSAEKAASTRKRGGTGTGTAAARKRGAVRAVAVPAKNSKKKSAKKSAKREPRSKKP